MKKAVKKSLSMLLLVALFIGSVGMIQPDRVRAAEPTPVVDSGYKWVQMSPEMLLYSVAYGEINGADYYWAAGDFGGKSSSDLVNWSPGSIGSFTKPINVIKYLNNNFIIGTRWYSTQTGPTFLRSSNGSDWTQGTTLSDGPHFTVNSIAYGNNTYVAVLTNGKIAVSTDGLSWGGGAGPGDSFFPYSYPFAPVFHDIAFIDGRFVAVGEKTESDYVTKHYAVAESPDGINWGEPLLTPLAWEARNYPASVAGSGSNIITARGPTAYRLDLSQNSSQTFIPIAGLGLIQKVAYGDIDGGTFVAVGDSGDIKTSRDAIAWSSESLPPYPGIIRDVTAADGTFIAVGGTGVYKRVKNVVATTTTVTATQDSFEAGTAVTLTATVTPAAAGDSIPSGNVTFTGPDGLNAVMQVNYEGKAFYSATDLTTGTIKATYSGDPKFGASSGTISLTATPHTIAAIQPQTLAPLIQGYSEGLTHVIQVTNTGSSSITNLTATLSGDGADDFMLTQPGSVVYNGHSTTLSVKAREGLTAGTYEATVTLSAPDLTPVSFPVTQAVNLPDAPVNPQQVTAVGGDHQVRVSWESVTGATYYHIYMSTVSGQYDDIPVDTVTNQVYSTIDDLINGIPHYFVVKAGNPGGLSGASNQAQATPGIVPGAPGNVNAVAGEGNAVVSFEAPDDNGGSSITGYEVTSSPGGIVAAGTESPITVTGLTNGTAYTFTVKAINAVGSSASSASSNAVTPYAPSVEEPSPEPSVPSTPSAPSGPATSPKPANDVRVLVNGKEEQAGTATTNTVNDQTVTIITVNRQQLEEKLAAVGQGAVVTIPVSDASDVVISELNGEMVKSMETKQATLEIKTPYGTYTLPAAQMDIASISRQFGSAATLSDIKVHIKIGAPDGSSVKQAEQAAAQQALTLVAPAVEFTVEAIYGDSAVKVTDFHTYVERSIAVPDQADPNKITTGVVFDPVNGIRHVPTKVTKLNDQYYAQINSLSNSMYSVIWNPLTFKDVEGHWAKDAVNDMGSRLVINGVGSGMFEPDEAITRAEFAAIMMRGLGLKPAQGVTPFADVADSDWYHGVVKAANDYRLIDGFEDGSFHPQEKITREQAMVILAKAMAVTRLEVKASATNGGELLKRFSDGAQVSGWAKDSVQAGLQTGLMSGRSGDELAPQANITRAEVAALIQRMLQESGLI